ncbi:class IV adenylate cyclase [Candidatus Pacearchaeota archaeon]|nr:class IV adenylate cyclase [Candidatus Pacearchaeota archaeon]
MEKIEIELKFPLKETLELVERLKGIAKFISEERQIDSYLTPFHRNFIEHSPIYEWLRIREYHRDGKVLFNLNYKNFGSDKKDDTISCKESETDIEDVVALKNILKSLDFKEIIVVDKKRINFSYKDCIISIDSVAELGEYIEIEVEGEFGSLDEAKKHLFEVLREIDADVGDQLFFGYPQILMKKKGMM